MTSFLLDTRAFVWWVNGDDRVPQPLRHTLSVAQRVLVSDVSLWELGVKSALGKFQLVPSVRGWFEHHLGLTRFGSLAISRAHLAGVAGLPMHHRDPFDRLLIAQALEEHLTLVTVDGEIQSYSVPTIWSQ